MVLFAAIAAAVIQRARNARPLLGQFYAPLAVAAIAQAVVFAVYFPLRAAVPSSTVVSVASWIFVLSIPAIGLVCGAGRLDRRVQTATALERMARSLSDDANAADVRLALATALKDPSLRILHSFPGDSHAWVDESGSPVEPADADPARNVTHVSSGNWRIAIVHDASLADSLNSSTPPGSYALARLEMSRLTDELRDSLRDLAESRASRLTAEQDARQKIERDLHDGAQQRLVALRVKLGLAASVLAERDAAGAETAPRAGQRCRRDDRRSPGAGAWHLSPAAGAYRAQRCAAVGQPRCRLADHGARQRARPIRGRHRDDGVLRLLRGVAERRQTRPRAATGATISVWHDDRRPFRGP